MVKLLKKVLAFIDRWDGMLLMKFSGILLKINLRFKGQQNEIICIVGCMLKLHKLD